MGTACERQLENDVCSPFVHRDADGYADGYADGNADGNADAGRYYGHAHGLRADADDPVRADAHADHALHDGPAHDDGSSPAHRPPGLPPPRTPAGVSHYLYSPG